MPFPPVHPDLARALEERGFAEPTPVQAAVLEPDAAGRDLLVSAQTGSGKTLAFGLAMGPLLLGEEGGEPPEPRREPLALVVAPTRELALQVHRELEWLYAPARAKVVACVGGMDMRREQRALAQGARIVVGTPGRLRDHLERGNLDLGQLKAVVLDEADEMLDLGFREDLEFILDAANPERRTLMFSATVPREIVQLAKSYQKDAHRIAVGAKDQPHGDIEYRAVLVAPNELERAVVNVLRYFEARGALVFCATREAVRYLHGNLQERGFAAVALSGELSQAERTRALQSLRDGRARVCVATDVAARGIDLPDLGLVVHAELPLSPDTLLHRSGRTGRAGRKGTSVLIVPYTRRRKAERLIAAARVNVTWSGAPAAEEIRLRDQERLVRELSAVEEPSEEDRAAAKALLAERSAEDIAAALVRLHWSRLPAPEEGFDAPPPERERPPRAAADARSRPDGPRREDDSGDGPVEGDGGAPVWFRMNVGRGNNADPRWLIPLICRRGHVTKREIGEIRIFDRDTRFEIAGYAAERFAQALQRPDERAGDDGDVRIEVVRPDRPGPAVVDRPRYRTQRRDGGGGGGDYAPETRGPRAPRERRTEYVPGGAPVTRPRERRPEFEAQAAVPAAAPPAPARDVIRAGPVARERVARDAFGPPRRRPR